MNDHEFLRRSIIRIQQARADLEQYLSEPMAIHPADPQLDEEKAEKLKEVAKFRRLVENHAESYQGWVKWEAEQRERRLK